MNKNIILIGVIAVLITMLSGCSYQAKYSLYEQGVRTEIYTAADEESLWVDCHTYTT